MNSVPLGPLRRGNEGGTSRVSCHSGLHGPRLGDHLGGVGSRRGRRAAACGDRQLYMYSEDGYSEFVSAPCHDFAGYRVYRTLWFVSVWSGVIYFLPFSHTLPLGVSHCDDAVAPVIPSHLVRVV